MFRVMPDHERRAWQQPIPGRRRTLTVLFVDAINVKIRDGQVANRPIHVVMAVTVDGTRDILGIWAGDGGEGAKGRSVFVNAPQIQNIVLSLAEVAGTS